MQTLDGPLVQVRTPTYKRPEQLLRCLKSLQSQTHQNWVCDVYDDDPQGAGESVCAALGDSRIFYHKNQPQKFASRNIDQCFSADNPHGADYFCVVEDDNFILDAFFAANIEVCESKGVHIVLRNQKIEYNSGGENASLSSTGVLDGLYKEGLYDAHKFRQSLLFAIGVSNGGLFWSAKTRSALEIGFPCTATVQEYMRTFSIVEPIYVAMTPLAVWAENAEQTTRNDGLDASYLVRELNLKRTVQALRAKIWSTMSKDERRQMVVDDRFETPADVRAIELAKSLLLPSSTLSMRRLVNLLARGIVIRLFGRTDPTLQAFIKSRVAQY
ncbi:hypothetical protein AEAC466_21505 [Asticcacaulis sp. AC466]|uniref:glycosyltransferase family 2 protein n=1 Tax=Asticcacaulis sp. AC466 TaxID=1282362 RepID=UPI0003C3FF9F|nr:glycosyltransferase [Asticcacaulis sp. AC466]ESQ81409.1 hypothetical protein AEAC466_21505 [Asticcacaulis sp. AC466]